jgi:hypothetical protein
MWWKQRRPEIVEGLLKKYVYGRMPKDLPKVTWTVTASDHELVWVSRR